MGNIWKWIMGKLGWHELSQSESFLFSSLGNLPVCVQWLLSESFMGAISSIGAL